eukprot:TRINITY_DN85736_c0_g1_i1.p1 TRINITY_DN85736_c0_g1~~TRINITY_DN85736_c0_g1_i1.p1  ORF type:complete len:333 (-),score=47.23 TRINITY_DN85736_c0_g1_i1:33-1007(-)
MTCIKGLDAFSGAGTNMFASQGAQQGFCSTHKHVGFLVDTITFGTIENGKLLLFETASSKKLGDGRDSAYLAKEIETGNEYAMKMYMITDPAKRRTIFADLYAHQSQVGKHPRIVGYERVIESEKQIFVLMEYLRGKDLFDAVASKVFSEQEARPLFRQMLEGLQHLHDLQVIHCDLKAENVMLLGSRQDGTAEVRIIDFGCSCFTSYEADTAVCTAFDPLYQPPELAENPGLVPVVATDIWRLGCTLYVMLMQHPPFQPDANTKAGIENRKNGNFYKDLAPNYKKLSQEAKDLLSIMIAGDPSKRPTCKELLEHPWVVGTSLQ